MNDSLELDDMTLGKPALPVPLRQRWQPLRIGVVELFHYDSEEFWFRDGHLLLRGNNGTGKSKVLSLTMPFLFDAYLRSNRIEPDGDSGKKMSWNLLMNSYPRRIGYTWIEFGRIDDSGKPHYMTLGAGLSAVEGRSHVDSWFFILEDMPERPQGTRIGQDMWLTNSSRVVLTKERLREMLNERGQLFDNATSYRRAVDERLFHLGPKRYDALMDTLIQLRQPQLSKKPDEAGLSNALTQALPPMPAELLGDVADSLNKLEENRLQLEEFQRLASAVEKFNKRYCLYASTLSRREVLKLRKSQTDFENSSSENNEAQARIRTTLETETEAKLKTEQGELSTISCKEFLETLQSDPTMQDGNRLSLAQNNVTKREAEALAAQGKNNNIKSDLQREQGDERTANLHREHQRENFLGTRSQAVELAERAGLNGAYADNPLLATASDKLPDMATRDIEISNSQLHVLAERRVEQLTSLRRRHQEMNDASSAMKHSEQTLNNAEAELAESVERSNEADIAVEQEGEQLIIAWESYCAGLKQLFFEASEPLAKLSEWVLQPDIENPTLSALNTAQFQHMRQQAEEKEKFNNLNKVQRQEKTLLEAEQVQLLAGEDQIPPRYYTRGENTRDSIAGAPLWKLIDFDPQVDVIHRGGLEAALEAAGLLDAWVTPDGDVLGLGKDGHWEDVQLLPRSPVQSPSLSHWLHPSIPEGMTVSAAIIQHILSSIACGTDDAPDTEVWISPEGHFRLGSLAGFWTKTDAMYIGMAARASARMQRLKDIDERLAQLHIEMAKLARFENKLHEDRLQAEDEWSRAPSDQPLQRAHLNIGHCQNELRRHRGKADEARNICSQARLTWQEKERRMHADAGDMRLPTTLEALLPIEESLRKFNTMSQRLAYDVKNFNHSQLALVEQQARLKRAQAQAEQYRIDLENALIEEQLAQAHFNALRETTGLKVDALLEKIKAAKDALGLAEKELKTARTALQEAAEQRAVAAINAENKQTIFHQRSEERSNLVVELQRFAQTGLLQSALPDIELPNLKIKWTVEPALTLARRIEQLLNKIKIDDQSWANIQKHSGEDFTELQRSLSALGHQAQTETNDWGMVVYITYQNRSERPDDLALRLEQEIVQRTEVLTAHEREVLENYLQSEIAAELQRLLQGAEKQVEAINKELQKRPTSTGVRFRLLWQPLSEAEDAPVGLELARKRLLNTSLDLWSAEDRRTVGVMLQQRIKQERDNTELGTGKDGSGNLIDQLARALDYRRWHRFRVERWQEGHWRKLSGPASSGERALGLTVPLFAAVSSFYTQGNYPWAPRLMLLDEAFAGIDDLSRAHCMGLIREFDLDFIITSEREWACYAELPGVAICQLQRSEGIDAIFVSRWAWDGKARRREDDPDRRFAPV